ncbi:glycosyltransferase [Methanospirillum sp.]|uniref:glycosyltransferase n=1 Tax=Methanospirillum sp. TaxID=45200 RepID=UPI001BD39A5B|nr:glycosyltransferase [Methanospirillum sp.]
MRIALLTCREFKIPGGAERLEIDIALALNATIVCLDVDPDFENIYPISQKVKFHPLKIKLPGEPLKQIFGMIFFRFIKLDYDFYILMDDMTIRYLVHKVPHVYYMHTPRRILYDMYYPSLEEYNQIYRIIIACVFNIIRFFDRRFIKKFVKNIACNSHNTRNRIWKIYQKGAKVLYPPVHVKDYHVGKYDDFWLSVSRIDKWKRIELQMEVFRLLPSIRFIVAGKIYPKYVDIIKEAPDNLTFLDAVTDEKLHELYSTCRGFLTTAIDEDFGITPLEAMAAGKPVVAVYEGGYKETVADGYTGLLVAPVAAEIAGAIRDVDQDPSRFGHEARKRAELFDYKIFKEQLEKYVQTCYRDYTSGCIQEVTE